MKKMLMCATVASMIGQFNMDNIQILQEMGYEVHIACDFFDRSVWTEERIKKFRKQLKGLGIKYFQVSFSRSPMKLKQHRKSYQQLIRLFNKNKYAFVHCHTPIAGVICRIAAHKMHVKCIYTAHGFHFYSGAPLKNWIIYYPIERFFSRWTDILITINSEDYKRAKKFFHAGKVQYIPGVGVDVEKFRECNVNRAEKRKELDLPEKVFVLLSVGELQARKNHKIVIEALHRLNNPDIYYLIVGKGELEEEYAGLIKGYSLGKNVRLLGYRTDIDEICIASDCFVHPSIREGLGIAPLEAMASGLPLISADVNGIRDYTKNGVTGYCVNPESVEDMSRAIDRMWKEEEFRIKCGYKNMEIVKQFDILKTHEIMRETYSENLMGGYKHIQRLLIRHEKRKEFGFATDDFVIISVGELNDNKNHRTIIEAVKCLPDEKIKYVICGIGELQNELTDFIAKSGLQKRVFLLGYRNDIRDILWMGDIFAFPSKREGLGLAAIEAMAAGLPLVTSDIHGIRDYSLNGSTGYSCGRQDIEGFAKAIARLRVEKEKCTEMQKFNVDYAQKFSKYNTNIIMRKVYREK